MAAPAEVLKVFGCEVGYLGPVGAPVPVIADYAAAEIADFVCGANDNDHHLSGVNWARDCAEPEAADLRMIAEGAASPDGVGTITFYRAIEGGHIFQLATKYPTTMEVTVPAPNATAVTPE